VLLFSSVKTVAILTALLPAWLIAQNTLSSSQAVALALQNHPLLKAGAAAEKAAAAHVRDLKGAKLPRVDYTESWTRSNNQVFVFGSLLEQQQFAAQNFDLEFLNQPPFLNNFQSQVIAEQSVYDNGLRRERIRSAELQQQIAGEQSRQAEMEVIQAVLRAYYTAVLSTENARVAAESVRSAEADLERAQNRLGAGVATDADVLSIRVFLASARERQIHADSGVMLASATLNQAMGVPLDTSYGLTTALTAAPSASADMSAMEADALAHRPELRGARFGIAVNEAQARAAHAAFLPEFFIRGGAEADRQRFITRGGANWMASAGLRWNVFNGFSTKARQQAAQHEAERSRAQEHNAESIARLEVRRAAVDLQSVTQRIEVSRFTVEMAQESLRIIRNRYDAGLTTVTELLRAETALLEAQTRELEAVRDQRIAAVAVEAARGTLTKDSNVVTQP
jgi:outer membrane protein TolC